MKNKTQASNLSTQKITEVSPSFEWLYIIFSFWFLIGLYWDAWAHTHIPGNESFFTIYHLTMYTGAGALSALVIYKLSMNYAMTGTIVSSIPTGYGPALAGVIVFMGGGVGDMLWHTLFGIEQNLEAAFSPTHMLLMLGIQLFMIAPFYSAWIRGEKNEGKIKDQLPKIFSFAFLLSGLMVISQWAHPFVVAYATQDEGFASEGVGMLSFFVQTVFLMGLILLSVKEEMLPVGSYTLALTTNAIALTLMRGRFEFIVIAILTGLVIDLIVSQSYNQRIRVRLTALIVPLIYFTLYFLVLSYIDTIVWSIHLISGAIAISVAISLLMSIFIVPPPRELMD